MKYEYFLIDLDHTLFDFDRAEREAFRDVLARRGTQCSELQFQRYQMINRGYWKRLSEGLVDKQRVLMGPIEDWAKQENLSLNAEETSHEYLLALSRFGYPIDGAKELAEALHQRGRIAIVTNGAAVCQYGKVRNLGIEAYVDALIISEEAGCEKPFPGIFEKALSALGCRDKSRALMIGDDPVSDMKGAQNAGLDALLFDPAGRHADVPCTFSVRALSDIVPLLEAEA